MSPSQIAEAAARIFGTTQDLADTAYILRDGRGVCFSSMGDHTEVFLAFPKRQREELREKMDSELDISTTEFLRRTGAIRIAMRDERESNDILYVYFSSIHRPTHLQLRRVREAVQCLRGAKTLVMESGRMSVTRQFARPWHVDDCLARILAHPSGPKKKPAVLRKKTPRAVVC